MDKKRGAGHSSSPSPSTTTTSSSSSSSPTVYSSSAAEFGTTFDPLRRPVTVMEQGAERKAGETPVEKLPPAEQRLEHGGAAPQLEPKLPSLLTAHVMDGSQIGRPDPQLAVGIERDLSHINLDVVLGEHMRVTGLSLALDAPPKEQPATVTADGNVISGPRNYQYLIRKSSSLS